jgi:hypothetical protein
VKEEVKEGKKAEGRKEESEDGKKESEGMK